jgi:hypothetical protein
VDNSPLAFFFVFVTNIENYKFNFFYNKMSDEDNVKDEDELGENTFSSLDFESDEVEDVDPAVLAVVDPLALDAELPGAIIEDPLDMENEDVDDADDLDDGFSEFNDYEE